MTVCTIGLGNIGSNPLDRIRNQGYNEDVTRFAERILQPWRALARTVRTTVKYPMPGTQAPDGKDVFGVPRFCFFAVFRYRSFACVAPRLLPFRLHHGKVPP
jgi:hypothetical protein